jgi:hypothetical protein
MGKQTNKNKLTKGLVAKGLLGQEEYLYKTLTLWVSSLIKGHVTHVGATEPVIYFFHSD